MGDGLNPILFAALALAAAAPGGARPAPGGPPGPLFISPMGEPFRGGAPADGLARWFAGVDADGDVALIPAELARDAARFFATLDSDGDGELGPTEISRYEREIAPEIQLGTGGPTTPRMRRMMRRQSEDSGGGSIGGRRFEAGTRRERGLGLQGAGRFGLLNIPEPVMDADADLNRGVSRREFAAAANRRFPLLDTNRDGRLDRAELTALLPRQEPRRGKKARRP
jgi:EF hand domain-containing protein